MPTQTTPYRAIPKIRVPIRNTADYSPFGLQLDGRTVSGDSYRYGFNGMEKDDEIKNIEGSSYDFGARMYDSRLGRWFATDNFFAKRPIQSPYSFVGNNPIINKEIDGNDYEIIINKSDKGNTITIKATVYTDVKGSDSHNATTKATEFWNSQNGKFKYQVNEVDGTTTEYDVVFDLTIVPTNNVFDAQDKAHDDPTGNSLTLIDKVPNGGFGFTEDGERSFVIPSRKDTDTPAHEVGHDLNLGHFPEGIMKEIDTERGITRESVVTTENVQQIIDYAMGKEHQHKNTALEGLKANTKLTNLQEVKVEGKVVEKE